jgi:diphthine methyl ester synthase
MKQFCRPRKKLGGDKMLYIIGLGLDIGDISAKSLEIIKKSKKAYLESYTIEFPYDISKLEKQIGKKLIIADRKRIESGAEEIIGEAKKEDISILVYGDPLSATTHSDIIIRARKDGVKTIIIHNASVINAVSDTGLQLYKFGKIASIPKWQKSFKPESFYDIYKENDSIKAHTLFLLDIGLDAKEALSYIKEISEKRGEKLPNIIIACSMLGTEHQEIIKGTFETLSKKKIKNPSCIIFPSSMHFIEAEMIEGI